MRFQAPVQIVRYAPVMAALVAFLGTCPVASAAPTGRPLEGDERIRAVQALQARQRDVASLRAAVVQRKRHPLLKDEVVTEGSLIVKRPDRVRWEMTRPERAIVVIEGNTLLVYHPERGEAERRDLRDDFGTRAAAEFLTAGFGLAVEDLERRFRVDVYREGGWLRFWLTPKSAWVAKVITEVVITQEDGDALPRRIVVVGAKGDRTETLLTDVTLNAPLPADAFALRLGPDVRVVDMRRLRGDTGSDR
jgi:outer membrane lipoprotein-sorting protein